MLIKWTLGKLLYRKKATKKKERLQCGSRALFVDLLVKKLQDI